MYFQVLDENLNGVVRRGKTNAGPTSQADDEVNEPPKTVKFQH
jgi:hypothetical protein